MEFINEIKEIARKNGARIDDRIIEKGRDKVIRIIKISKEMEG
jgi:hypothetical protein